MTEMGPTDDTETLRAYIASLEAELSDTNEGLVALTLELEDAKEQYRSVIDNSVEGIYRTDRDGKVVMANPALAQLFGYETVDRLLEDELRIGDRFLDPARWNGLIEELADTGRVLGAVIPLTGAEGQTRVVSHNVRALTDNRGALIGMDAVVIDITERQLLEERLSLIAKVFEYSVEGIVITDADTTILEVNRAFSTITGYRTDEAVGHKTDLLYSGWQDSDFYKHMWEKLETDGVWIGEIRDRRKNGEFYVQHLTICAIAGVDGAPAHYIGIFTDITEKKLNEKKVRQLAYYDLLTRLPNRTLLMERLSHGIRTAERENYLLAILFIDLDNFKNINDMRGHHAGDKFLQQVADRFTACVRGADTVARLGGDEFVILLEDIKDPQNASSVAKQVIDEMRRGFNLGEGDEVFSGASIGIAIYPSDGENADTILKHADTAMYTAKEQGKNDYHFFREEMNVKAMERLRLETDLRRALENDDFVLFYQPKVDLASGRIHGAEALIRWRHPELGLVLPDRFIPLAEKSPLIESIGEWVIRSAFATGASWRERGVNLSFLSVNVSARQLGSRGFLATIEKTIADTGAIPTDFELELTESAVMSDAESSIEKLRALRDMGFRIALDDFGTGYSSLNYLKRLPIGAVKIDRSFVRDIMFDESGRAIVRAIIALSHKMNLEVIAEGVEKEDEREFLVEQGCDFGQGYLFHKPMEEPHLMALLGKAPSRRGR